MYLVNIMLPLEQVVDDHRLVELPAGRLEALLILEGELQESLLEGVFWELKKLVMLAEGR